jgi:hypothetical protein
MTESGHLVNSDHERLHDLVVEREQGEASQPEESPTGDTGTGQMTPRSPSASSPTSDSEQAQANLERMLETGEENPIS